MAALASALGDTEPLGRACYRGSMRRPRWHDVLIVAAILALAVAGAWALWWDDVRPDGPHGPPPASGPAGKSSAT